MKIVVEAKNPKDMVKALEAALETAKVDLDMGGGDEMGGEEPEDDEMGEENMEEGYEGEEDEDMCPDCGESPCSCKKPNMGRKIAALDALKKGF